MRRDEIVELLTELGSRLAVQAIEGEMYVVGGAAIALAFDSRRSTQDIDAVFEPKAEIYEAAAAVASERGLPDGWLNDAVKGFLTSADPESPLVLEVAGLRVSTASPRILLAMKVLSHRVGEDEADVRLLAAQLGLTTPSEVLAVAESVYGDRLDAAAQFFVEQLYAS
jgi:hypothetical protein